MSQFGPGGGPDEDANDACQICGSKIGPFVGALGIYRCRPCYHKLQKKNRGKRKNKDAGNEPSSHNQTSVWGTNPPPAKQRQHPPQSQDFQTHYNQPAFPADRQYQFLPPRTAHGQPFDPYAHQQYQFPPHQTAYGQPLNLYAHPAQSWPVQTAVNQPVLESNYPAQFAPHQTAFDQPIVPSNWPTQSSFLQAANNPESARPQSPIRTSPRGIERLSTPPYGPREGRVTPSQRVLSLQSSDNPAVVRSSSPIRNVNEPRVIEQRQRAPAALYPPGPRPHPPSFYNRPAVRSRPRGRPRGRPPSMRLHPTTSHESRQQALNREIRASGFTGYLPGSPGGERQMSQPRQQSPARQHSPSSQPTGTRGRSLVRGSPDISSATRKRDRGSSGNSPGQPRQQGRK